MQYHDNTPIIVGIGQKTWLDADATRTPVDALYAASAAAISDANCEKLSDAIDGITMVRFIADTNPGIGALFPRNPGGTLAERLGIKNAAISQGIIGGNTPQYLVNHLAGKLARSEHSVVLLAGAELLATLFNALRTGDDISAWAGEAQKEPPTIGQEREGLNAMENAHGLYEPINTYPLFENSLKHHLQLSDEQNNKESAAMCSAMSQVAADNPYAWERRFKTPEEIRTVQKSNRYIGYPYTRAMNPILSVDMSAAVVMTTAGKAAELGIDPQRWVFLRGGADVNDIWYPSERPCLHDSPAIGKAWDALSQHCSVSLDEISRFDIYSCFPSAVKIACNEIGLSPLDPRGVTVTGGLPFFGGPGNNYSLHAIAQMVDTLRNKGEGHGLVTANGLYLTKHSLGLYSTEPPAKVWQDIDSAALQKNIDAAPRLPVASDATGTATIETFTVGFDRDGPKQGIVIARNTAGERIVANTLNDSQTLEQLLAEDPIGHTGKVRVADGIHTLEL
ncbi:MAG: acetyl-CoA C-acetyltransferase [Halioglobus sp.]|jgi:acetyl-CoA C-acetyltransferase